MIIFKEITYYLWEVRMKKLYLLFQLLITIALLQNANVLFAQTWYEQVSGVTVSLNSASDIDFFNGWICGDSGTVLKSINAGNNWINFRGNGIPTNVSLVNIYGFDANNAVTAGYIGSNTFVYRTSNGGTNWSQVFTQSNGFINAIWMNTSSNGFMEGNPVSNRWSLWKTTNGGASWDSTGLFLAQSGAERGWRNSLFVQGTKIWFGTNNSRIYSSSNNGSGWSIQSTVPEINVYSLWVINTTGYCGGASLLKTTNMGNTWNQINSLDTGNINGLVGQGNCVWYVRSSDEIYFSNTGGNNWVIQFTAPSGIYNHISNNRLPYNSSVWAVRNNGGITRTDLIEVGISHISNEVPEKYSINQNFPNPFNPNSKIRFQIPELSFTKLIVYDVLGREITILVNEQLKAGVYEVNFNGINFPSGIYFYRISSGIFVESKRMILIK